MKRQQGGRRAGSACAWVLAGVASAVVAAGDVSAADPRFRGQTLKQWAEALNDLDPVYRREAATALSAFGLEAAPYLRAALRDPDDRVVASVCRGLVRLGPPGETVISEVLREGDLTVKQRTLWGLGEAADEARGLVPLLETYAVQPEIALAVLQTLGKLRADPGVGAKLTRVSSADGSLDMEAGGCLVVGLFPLIGVRVRAAQEAQVSDPRLYFTSLASTSLKGSDYYYVELGSPARDAEGGLSFEGKLPRPTSAATVVRYYASAIVDGVPRRTPEVAASIVAQQEMCEGLERPAMRVGPPGPVTPYKARR